MSHPHGVYLEAAATEARARLEAIRAEAEVRVPGAERCIAYQMPALRKGVVFFYFAASKKHIGIYPPVEDRRWWRNSALGAGRRATSRSRCTSRCRWS